MQTGVPVPGGQQECMRPFPPRIVAQLIREVYNFMVFLPVAWITVRGGGALPSKFAVTLGIVKLLHNGNFQYALMAR